MIESIHQLFTIPFENKLYFALVGKTKLQSRSILRSYCRMDDNVRNKSASLLIGEFNHALVTRWNLYWFFWPQIAWYTRSKTDWSFLLPFLNKQMMPTIPSPFAANGARSIIFDLTPIIIPCQNLACFCKTNPLQNSFLKWPSDSKSTTNASESLSPIPSNQFLTWFLIHPFHSSHRIGGLGNDIFCYLHCFGHGIFACTRNLHVCE